MSFVEFVSICLLLPLEMHDDANSRYVQRAENNCRDASEGFNQVWTLKVKEDRSLKKTVPTGNHGGGSMVLYVVWN